MTRIVYRQNEDNFFMNKLHINLSKATTFITSRTALQKYIYHHSCIGVKCIISVWK